MFFRLRLDERHTNVRTLQKPRDDRAGYKLSIVKAFGFLHALLRFSSARGNERGRDQGVGLGLGLGRGIVPDHDTCRGASTSGKNT